MPLTVMSDAQVRAILLSLNRDEVISFQRNLIETLHDYSTGTQETTVGCSTNQPHRLSVPLGDGQTTLFMPARTSKTTGIKIVSLASASPSEPAFSRSSSSVGSSNASKMSSDSSLPVRSAKDSTSTLSSTASLPNSSSSALSNPASTSTSTLSTPPPSTSSRTSSPSRTGANGNSKKSHTTILDSFSSRDTQPTGTLTLLSPNGSPYAFLSATTLTAFRTALASSIFFMKRASVHTITVFGAGAQAYWHIRLALILRGSEIHHVNIVNRTFAGAESLMKQIYTHDEWAHLRTANSKLRFSLLSKEYGEYDRIIKEHVRDADVIFTCTPSTQPIFPPEFLTNSEGRKKGRYVCAIGSYKPHMIELHPDIVRLATSPGHRNHHHRHAERAGVVVVDSLEACMKEAGEIIQAGISGEQMVEVGELAMVKKAVAKEEESGGQGEKGLKRWLHSGDVVYKSVGMGIMDLTVGEDLLKVGEKKGVGIVVDDF